MLQWNCLSATVYRTAEIVHTLCSGGLPSRIKQKENGNNMIKEIESMTSDEANGLFLSALRTDFSLSGLEEYLTPENEDCFCRLYRRLTEENRRYNLTAVTDPVKAALLHFTDSVAVASLFPHGATLLDVGCGGGFPSLPLAIVRPDLCITACDATAKKTAYVAESARLLGLTNLTVLTGRAEELAHDARYRAAFSAVTARAVAALPVLTELCMPFVSGGGRFYALKGAAAADEERSAQNAVRLCGGVFTERISLSVKSPDENPERFCIIAEKRKATPEEYPRPYARILKKPL